MAKQTKKQKALASTIDRLKLHPVDEAIAFMNGGYSQADYDLYNAYVCNDDGTLAKADPSDTSIPDAPVDDPTRTELEQQLEDITITLAELRDMEGEIIAYRDHPAPGAPAGDAQPDLRSTEP